MKHSFCVQISREAVDQFEGIRDSAHAPISQRITVAAKPEAIVNLHYRVPIKGTNRTESSFLIECDLPDSTSRLPQKREYD